MNIASEHEDSVIGACLIRDGLADQIPLEPDHFADYRAKVSWEAILSLRAQGRNIDLALVEAEIERISSSKDRKSDWSTAYLGLCAAKFPTTEHAVEYATIVKKEWLHREATNALAELLGKAKNRSLQSDELIGEALRVISKLDAGAVEDATVTMPTVVKRRIKQLEDDFTRRERGEKVLDGAPTGIVSLDEKISGWPWGILSVVAARPGMGKSSLLMATAEAAVDAGMGVHVFSLEDSMQSYADRAISRTSGVAAEVLRTGAYVSATWTKLTTAFNGLMRKKLWTFDDSSGLAADEIVRRVRRKAKDNKTKVVIVDYIQLVKKPEGTKSVHEEITKNVQTLANAAKSDGMAYIIASQLNREVEKRSDKRPQLSDMRESGSIEEQSKCVVGLYRGSYYGDPVEGIDYEDGGQEPGEYDWKRLVNLLVLKNSNGQTGVCRGSWDGPTMTMK